MTRSLLNAGLSFERSFEIATQVRSEISGKKTTTSAELRDRVCELLKEQGEDDVLEHYCYGSVAPPRVLVSGQAGAPSAFSRGRHARYLQSTGLKTETAEQITEMLYAQLLASGVSAISTHELDYLSYLCLQQEVGNEAARNYLVWSEFQNSKRPLILLIGGTVASGKSTVATQIAHLLGIVRIQSTDMLREVMRMMIPERLLPVLHTSSFIAWQRLPLSDREGRDFDQLVAEGYRSQAELLAVPCEAVLQRAVEERVPIIMEGVHVHPELLELAPGDEDVIKVCVMLATLKSKQIKARLKDRGASEPLRKPKKYLDNLDSIWSLQSHLLSEADRCDVSIITSENREKAIFQIIQQVNVELARHFTGSAREVFGPVVDTLQPEGSETPQWQEIVPLLRG
jgi:2-phosphoglycerate kinase